MTPHAPPIRTRISARSISGSTAPSESASVMSSPMGSSSERPRRAFPLEDRGDDVLLRGVDRGRDLRHAGGAAQLVRELVARLGHAQPELLQRAWHAHGPGPVSEVALDLAEDGRRGVRGEAHLAPDIEAIDGLHDADAGDLHEILERLTAIGVSGGQGVRQREYLLRELPARTLVAVLVDAVQELPFAPAGTGGGHAGMLGAVCALALNSPSLPHIVKYPVQCVVGHPGITQPRVAFPLGGAGFPHAALPPSPVHGAMCSDPRSVVTGVPRGNRLGVNYGQGRDHCPPVLDTGTCASIGQTSRATADLRTMRTSAGASRTAPIGWFSAS